MLKLKKSSEFQRVYKNGRRFRGKNLRLYTLKNDTQLNKIGFVIPSNRTRLSVSRNRSKRIMSESYRLTEDLIKKGYDLILFADKDISRLKSEKIREELLFLYRKSGMFL